VPVPTINLLNALACQAILVSNGAIGLAGAAFGIDDAIALMILGVSLQAAAGLYITFFHMPPDYQFFIAAVAAKAPFQLALTTWPDVDFGGLNRG
jgi:hypothetical protein